MFIRISSAPDIEAGVEVGDLFRAVRYRFDPMSKVTLIEKISGSLSEYDKYSRNHYIDDVEIDPPLTQQEANDLNVWQLS